MKSAADFLREAAGVIEERGKLRDNADGERSMARAVSAYSVLRGDEIETELDGWLFMCVLKLARATAGKTHEDDWTDLAGYAALAAECLVKQNTAEAWLADYVDNLHPKWIYHSGEHNLPPVTDGIAITLLFANGETRDTDRAGDWYWGKGESDGVIVGWKFNNKES